MVTTGLPVTVTGENDLLPLSTHQFRNHTPPGQVLTRVEAIYDHSEARVTFSPVSEENSERHVEYFSVSS